MLLHSCKYNSCLTWEFNSSSDPRYEIYGAVRGLCLKVGGVDATGEGIGLGGVISVVDGVPFFPLDYERKVNGSRVVCRYIINGRPSKYLFNRRNIDSFYALLHRTLTPMYLGNRFTRPFYIYLMAVRTILGVRNMFEKTNPIGVVEATYDIEDSSIEVDVDLNEVDADGVFVANELSGRLFTQLYVDGVRSRRFEPWMNVSGCREAVLYSPYLRIAVAIPGLDSCKMFAGREVLARRLNWAGVSYFARPKARISYRVVIEDHAA